MNVFRMWATFILTLFSKFDIPLISKIGVNMQLQYDDKDFTEFDPPVDADEFMDKMWDCAD